MTVAIVVWERPGTARRQKTDKEETMFIRWLLFETKLGEWFLVALEHWAGLCVVQADWLGAQSCGVSQIAGCGEWEMSGCRERQSLAVSADASARAGGG